MKNILIVLLAFASFIPAVKAETFTLTRGYDNRTFFCTDDPSNPGNNPTKISVTFCDCKYASGNSTEGLAVIFNNADSPANQCKQVSASSKPFNCKTQTMETTQTVSCDCKYASGNSTEGEALVTPTSASAIQQCRDISASSKPFNCKIQ